MPVGDMPEYLREIERLKVKYSGRIEIYLGLEIDYLDKTYHASIPYFQSLPLDYRIGSIHFLPWRTPLTEDHMTAIDGAYDIFAQTVRERYRGDIRLITKDYFESTLQMIDAGGIDIVGHMDKIYMNGSLYPGFDRSADWFRKPFEACIDLIAEKGLIVEINTKNRSRKQQTYPHTDTLKQLLQRHIPIMVNSDCHVPDFVNDGREETLALLKETGFRTTRELTAGVWQDIAIE